MAICSNNMCMCMCMCMGMGMCMCICMCMIVHVHLHVHVIFGQGDPAGGDRCRARGVDQGGGGTQGWRRYLSAQTLAALEGQLAVPVCHNPAHVAACCTHARVPRARR